MVSFDHLLDGECSRCSNRVADVRVTVLEESAASADRVHDLVARQYGADGLVAAAQALGDGDQVGYSAFLLHGIQGPGAAHAAHHLVGDVENAVAVADVANALDVPGRGRHGTHGGSDDGLGAEGDDPLRAGMADGRVEFVKQPPGVAVLAFARSTIAVLVAGTDTPDVDEQRRELLAAPLVAAHGERSERVAVVALAPCDEQRPLGLADLDDMLARELQGGFDSLRSAGHEIGVGEACRSVLGQVVGEGFCNLAREEARVCIGQLVDLRVHGGQHVGLRVAEARDGGSSARVDVSATLLVDDVDAFGARRDGRRGPKAAVNDMGHRTARKYLVGTELPVRPLLAWRSPRCGFGGHAAARRSRKAAEVPE